MRKILLVFTIIVLVLSLFAIVGCDNTPSTSKVARYVDFYAINDFHGETGQMSSIGGFIKRNKDGNSVVINSGDMFQGSMESNSNWGQLLDDCMEEIGFDCFTIGNHEFDWGMEKLTDIVTQSKVKYLGANIYYWDNYTKTFGDFADELADEYIVKTLENGLKVGVIGIIGTSQITSISSNLVENIGFKDPVYVVPALSQKLREEEKCDVVVVSVHDGGGDVANDYSFDITEYADAVFCAHTHEAENFDKNGVPFIQGDSDGKYLSKVRLKVDTKGNVSCERSENLAVNSSWPKDEVITSLVNQAKLTIQDQANEVLATLTNGYLNSGMAIPRLVCKAIANYALQTEEGKNIDLVIVNSARSSLQAGSITYSKLYEALPFDNVIYIVKVSGSDLLRNAQASSYNGGYYYGIWRVNPNAFSESGEYTIAVIDYLLFHQNDDRNYNYYPSAFYSGKQRIALKNVNYREITRDYLRQVQTINATDFVNANNNTDNSLLKKSVTLDDAQSTAQASVITNANLPIASYVAILPTPFKLEGANA